ncbi:MAG TPA: transglycosylase SLT domain-containing protein [Chloroflexota bacterium]|nr:transglycosylase SLT domain-containing protein [Chloroflexota bacterium]
MKTRHLRSVLMLAVLAAGCAAPRAGALSAGPVSEPLVSLPIEAPPSQPAAAVVEPDPVPAPAPEVESVPAGRQPWQPPNTERRAFPRRVERWRDLVREVLAQEWDHGTLDGPASRLDDDLVLAVMEQESGGNPRAESWAGAMGLMQVMDFTFALMMAGDESLAPLIDPAAFWDERSNVRAGIRYLALAMQYHEGDVYWSLASYNAGIGNARTWRLAGLYAVPPIGGFSETASYAPAIMRSYMRHRPDVQLYVPDVMPEEHLPGALELLRTFRRRR